MDSERFRYLVCLSFPRVMQAEISSHKDLLFVIWSVTPIDIRFLKHEEMLKRGMFLMLINGKEDVATAESRVVARSFIKPGLPGSRTSEGSDFLCESLESLYNRHWQRSEETNL